MHFEQLCEYLKGRNGKGTIYIWASGNGGENEDDCSCDGYVSHWNIISIGSVNHRGMKPYFMELCPSTMAVVYSGGQTSIAGDADDPGVRVIASDVCRLTPIYIKNMLVINNIKKLIICDLGEG